MDYARLLEWAGGSGVISRPAVARLLAIARDRPEAARSAYRRARWARWVLQRLLTSVAATQPSDDALEHFNRLLRHVGQHLRLVYTRRGRGAVEWRPVRADDLDAVLWLVARSAAKLLKFDAPRLRVCAGPDCGWVYIDRSRNGLRRWCEMQTCGTLSKSRRRAARLARARTYTGRRGHGERPTAGS